MKVDWKKQKLKKTGQNRGKKLTENQAVKKLFHLRKLNVLT